MARRVWPMGAPLVAAILVVACGGGGATPAPAASTQAPSVAATVAGPSARASIAASTPTAPASASPSSAAPQTPSAEPSSSPRSTAPPSFALTVAGDANVQGTWGKSFGVICNNPTVNGPDLLFFSQSPDGKAVVLITLQPNSIAVSERAGSGATYTDREFQGTGVTAFDPATGATFDSAVSDVTPSGSKTGTLGSISHVTGTVDCGSQTVGTSTLTVTGSTPDGVVDGPFSSFRVACTDSTQYGKSVTVDGIVTAGSNPTSMILHMPSNYPATVFASGKDPATNTSYQADPAAGTYTVTDTGAQVDADFVQSQAPNGPTPPPTRLHVSGDVTCGTFNKTS